MTEPTRCGPPSDPVTALKAGPLCCRFVGFVRPPGRQCQLLCPVDRTLPDPDDRHVVAQHPDVFLRHPVDLQPALVRARIQQMLQRWRQPPATPEAFIDALERAGLPDVAAALRVLFAAG